MLLLSGKISVLLLHYNVSLSLSSCKTNSGNFICWKLSSKLHDQTQSSCNCCRCKQSDLQTCYLWGDEGNQAAAKDHSHEHCCSTGLPVHQCASIILTTCNAQIEFPSGIMGCARGGGALEAGDVDGFIYWLKVLNNRRINP